MIKNSAATTLFTTGLQAYTINGLKVSGLSDHYSHVYEFYITWVPNTALEEKIQFMLSVKVNTEQALSNFNPSFSGNYPGKSDLYWISFLKLVASANVMSSVFRQSDDE